MVRIEGKRQAEGRVESDRKGGKREHREGSAGIESARVNNLKTVSVGIPAGVLTVVTGVAGAGKSSLIQTALPAAYPDTIVIDQNLARGSRRSNTATYTGILDNGVD